jgi:hypothetical protein
MNATVSEDQKASPFLLRYRKGNICHRAYPAPCPTEAKRAGNFFPVVPFLESEERGTEQAFPAYRRLKPPRSDKVHCVNFGAAASARQPALLLGEKVFPAFLSPSGRDNTRGKGDTVVCTPCAGTRARQHGDPHTVAAQTQTAGVS